MADQVGKEDPGGETDMSDAYIKHVFDLLREMRKFPKYQLERRLDIFIQSFLAEFLSQHKYFKGQGGVKFVAPEFPLLTPKKNRKTYNADYLLYSRDYWVLVELKTDHKSLKDAQIRKYLDDTETGMTKLLGKIKYVQEGSGEKGKYAHLIKAIEDAQSKQRGFKVLVLAPSRGQSKLKKKTAEQCVFISLKEMARWKPKEYGRVWSRLVKFLQEIDP